MKRLISFTNTNNHKLAENPADLSNSKIVQLSCDCLRRTLSCHCLRRQS